MRWPSSKGKTLLVGGIVTAVLLSACTASDRETEVGTVDTDTENAAGDSFESPGAERLELRSEDPLALPIAGAIDVRVIRDAKVDLRIDYGTFGQTSAELRNIAEDFGGYVSSGESHLEEIEDVSYTVGWFTLRVPEDRFEEALARAEALGERLGLRVSSQDVSEEYVDLEGRLDYWESQEAFYLRLIDEATETSQLVALQTQMRDVLLSIEQIEGRLRYLDSRTQFSTLTVGLTEIPGAAPIVEPKEPGILEDALDQAGTVLLSTVAFLIVAAAFLIPIGIVGLVAYTVWRAVSGTKHDPEPTEAHATSS
ncbi:MAG: hypothetical protein BMS9Abin07_2212 [Acidimicrobiia bacterium]|nr:MAG: hypothetical protein BMS9Abin07_2212 [Acidimicrobiia bacterium]